MRATDQRMLYDGMSANVMSGTGGRRIYSLNQVGIEEMVVGTGGGAAEMEVGSVYLNAIPKEGGNAFSFYSIGFFTNESLQNDNLDDELRGLGLSAAPGVKRIYDAGFGIGGRVIRDRLWFYSSNRWWGASEYQPGAFFNKSTNPLFYEPDTSRRTFQDNHAWDSGLRVTWNAAEKHRVTFSNNIKLHAFVMPERAPPGHPRRPRIWSTIRCFYRRGHGPIPRRIDSCSTPACRTDTSISIIGLIQTSQELLASSELSTGQFYANTGYDICCPGGTFTGKNQAQNPLQMRGSVSYVTRSHAFKTGLLLIEDLRR